jgi:hypothetical protein
LLLFLRASSQVGDTDKRQDSLLEAAEDLIGCPSPRPLREEQLRDHYEHTHTGREHRRGEGISINARFEISSVAFSSPGLGLANWSSH